jgi:proton-dependent oligopeptide transporter, POT family
VAIAPTAQTEPHEAASQRGFFGHPAGLSTLFFTEMWERFSFYGMRAFLLLYMTAAASVGGMGLDAAIAAPIYGMYTSLVYLSNLPGGWIADRLLGPRRAVLYGAIIIACGHFSLAVPATAAFYLGLLLIVLGTGLLKPNISVMVGQLYTDQDVRRDSAFSIFYMGINLGAFIGPLITGFLAQSDSFRATLAGWGFDPNSAWHWGFGAAGVGMTLGIVQYIAGGRRLGSAGLKPVATDSAAADSRYRKRAWLSIGAGFFILFGLGVGIATGALAVTAKQVTSVYSAVLVAITIAFFAGLFVAGKWTRAERDRLYLIVVLFIAAALFWSVFEQAGSTLNLFADRSTDNRLFGYSFPSSWWQSVNALLIFILAPVFAWLWVKLGDRQPASPTKFALGLIGVGLGFLVLMPAAQFAAGGAKVGLFWLFAVYLVHTLAELCLSPVGLSAMTQLAPRKITSVMMGVWFLAASVGDFAAGQAASFYESMPLPRLLATVAVLPILAGVLMFVLRRPLISLIKNTE